MGVVKVILSLSLHPHCEVGRDHNDQRPASDETRPLLQDEQRQELTKDRKYENWPIKPSTLKTLFSFLFIFWLDQMGSGLVAPSWQAYYLWRRFGMEEGDLGSVFMGRNLLSSFGNLGVVPLARRFGLVPAMLAGHVPASILVIILPFPAVLWAAVLLVLARSPIYESDQAPRQAWLALILSPEERTAGLGVVNVWRELAQGAGLGVAGWIADRGDVGWAFVLGGGIKIVYDILLALLFWNTEKKAEDGKQDTVGEAEEEQ